jgi:reactive intermediate/imine deaminase
MTGSVSPLRRRALAATVLASAALATGVALPAAAAGSGALPGIERYNGAAGDIVTQYPFSLAVRAGHTIYLSGQVGLGPNGLAQGFEGQSRQAMDNLSGVLKGMKLSMDNVVKCNVMIGDMANWAAFNAIYKTYLNADAMPARSAMGANGLALGAAVEVECIAYAE